jgi:DNA polymerase-3 subunit beta
MFEVTAPTAPLAAAAARMSRLLPGRASRPAHGAVLLRADAAGLSLVAADDECGVRMRVPVRTHGAGEVVVSRSGLAETVGLLDAPEVRLVAEGARLAVRTPGARFALPRLVDTRPAPPDLPPIAGTLTGAALAVAVPVAGAASREHALPIFTGVRVRSDADRLSLLATDRYRLAAATLPWQASGHAVDALVPAAFLAEAARQAGRDGSVAVHAAGDLFALAWADGSVVTATLGATFPDTQLHRLLDIAPECVVAVGADAFAAAVDRASRYGGVHRRVSLRADDGALVVRASDPLTGESEETVKATVHGDHVTRHYQARLLHDALRPFAGQVVELRVQAGLRATEFTAAPGDLRYLVVPMRSDT